MNYNEQTLVLVEAMLAANSKEEKIQARNQIVELNIKLVSEVLKKYRPYTEDQFQNGCMGLIQATDTFDPSYEVPFSSWACRCIEQAIQKAYHQSQREVTEHYSVVYLDAETTLGNGDKTTNGDLYEDPEAELALTQFADQDEWAYLCETVIVPCISKVADQGRHMQTKLNIDHWCELEFLYVRELVFGDSQKCRLNLSQIADILGVSTQNIRIRHGRVMDLIFKEVWNYMHVSFKELLSRLRGDKKLPQRLLCLDPGKTTGWALFENGKLTQAGQCPDCFDDNNINTKALLNLFQEINPDYVVYEDYRVYAHKLERHTFSSVPTVRLLGVIETYCQMNDVPTHTQMAVTAKGFVTDNKLKEWGFWQSGQRHARDAIRHGAYFLLFHDRGKDLV